MSSIGRRVLVLVGSSLVVVATMSGPTVTNTAAGGPPGSTSAGASTFTWAAPQRALSDGPADLNSVSCPTSTFCMAVATDGNTLTYNGSSWTRHLVALPAQTWTLSCTATTFCMALGDDGSTQRWTGSSWTTAGPAPADRLSCSSPTFCVAGSPTAWSRWNGMSWAPAQNLPTTGLTSLSCATATFCVATFVNNGDVVSSDFNGIGWSSTVPVTALHGSTGASLSCASSTFCLSLGTTAVWASYTGSAWARNGTLPGGGTYDAVSCAAPTSCAALRDGSNIQPPGHVNVQATTFDGTSWSAFTAIQSDAQFPHPALSCAGPARCVAVSEGVASTWSGTSWSAATTIDPDTNSPVAGLSCSGPTSCAAITAQYGFVWNGTSWDSGHQLVLSTFEFRGQLTDVSCVSATFCMATIFVVEDINSDGGWARWDGTTWSTDLRYGLNQQSVSCVSTTFCVSVGGRDASAFDGTAWTTAPGVFGGYVDHVSCATPTFCVAVGMGSAGPEWSRYNGTTWSTLAGFGDSTATITSLSCRTTTFCRAVDTSGRTQTFDGTRWSDPVSIASSALTSVSCVQVSACLAVGPAVGAVQDLGAAGWRAQANVDSVGHPGSISCPTSEFCMVADDRGYTTIGRADAGTGYELAAEVDGDGSLIAATTGTTVTHPSVGHYDVTFPKDVRGCVPVANLGYGSDGEHFTFQSVVTAAVGSHGVVRVDVSYPGDTSAGLYPHAPRLRDNGFHLHVDCHHNLQASIAGNGHLIFGTPGATSQHLGTGSYRISFPGHNIRTCAPVATIRTPGLRQATTSQAFLALDTDPAALTISINRATTVAVDAPVNLIVTCPPDPIATFPASTGDNTTTTTATVCAATASWVNYTPGGPPSNQGYVSTWHTPDGRYHLLTKNGGYGVEAGFGTDLVLTPCD